MVWNGFPLWRWALVGRTVRGAAAGFASGMVRWLVQPRDLAPVTLVTPKPVYESGESVDLRAHVLDAQMAPQAGAAVRVDVRRVDDSTPVANAVLEPRTGDAGEYAAALPGLGPGVVRKPKPRPRSTAVKWDARGRDSRSMPIRPSSRTCSRMSTSCGKSPRAAAAGSGGPADVAAIAAALPRAARDVVLRSEIEVWNTAPLFILFVLVLGAEWLLRKRYGLL